MLTSLVEEKINAPVDRLYSAWSDAGQLSRWFTTSHVHDFRVGGSYHNDDKDEGVFLEIENNKKIRLTWENKEHCPGTEVEVIFEPLQTGSSKITIIHSKLSSQQHYDSMNTGWRWAVYSLKSYLETGKAVRYDEWGKLQNQPEPGK